MHLLNMMNTFDGLHLALEVVTALAGCALAYFALALRNSILIERLRQQEASATMKADLVAHNFEVRTDLEAHQASDEAKFAEILRAIQRMPGMR